MKSFKWIVEFTVNEIWVEDGFDLNEDRAKEMIESALPFSNSSETKVKIIKFPSKKTISKIQGE